MRDQPSHRELRLFDEQVVQPVLRHLAREISPAIDSLQARQLLLATAVAESNLLHGLQVPNGPARGRFQIEPGFMRQAGVWIGRGGRGKWLDALDRLFPLIDTCPDIQDGELEDLPERLETLSDHLCWNDWLGCAVARLLYWSIAEPLPAAGDWPALAAYWKAYYNRGGKGTPEKFLARTAAVQRYFAALEG